IDYRVRRQIWPAGSPGCPGGLWLRHRLAPPLPHPVPRRAEKELSAPRRSVPRRGNTVRHLLLTTLLVEAPGNGCHFPVPLLCLVSRLPVPVRRTRTGGGYGRAAQWPGHGKGEDDPLAGAAVIRRGD